MAPFLIAVAGAAIAGGLGYLVGKSSGSSNTNSSSSKSGKGSSKSGGHGGGHSGGGYSGGHVYNYEPDKVRIAEIERQTKLELADKETERIELMRDAKIELLKAQALTEAAIEKARADGMREMTDQLVHFQQEMLEIAEKRIVIIEKCALPIIREIETFYSEIAEKIQNNSEEYNTKKLPQLLEILGNYEEGSASFKIYAAQINDDRIRQGKFLEDQLQQVSVRQNTVLQSFLSSKDKILNQTGQITQTITEKLLEQNLETMKRLNSPNDDIKALPPSD